MRTHSHIQSCLVSAQLHTSQEYADTTMKVLMFFQITLFTV